MSNMNFSKERNNCIEYLIGRCFAEDYPDEKRIKWFCENEKHIRQFHPMGGWTNLIFISSERITLVPKYYPYFKMSINLKNLKNALKYLRMMTD